MGRFPFAAAAPVIAILATVAVAAQDAQVTGTLTYRERISLPPTAVVEVTLEDVSRVDVARDVVARAEIAWAGQSPIPFEIAYDAAAVDRSRRYGVRARIVDRGQVLFTAAQPALVITQGRGSVATVALTMVSAPSAVPAVGRMPQEPRTTAAVRLPPPIELRNLPATFTGTLSSPGSSASVRYELNLFPDDSYFLRTSPAGAGEAASTDAVGSWVLSSDRRALILEGNDGNHEVFAIRDNNTLRRLAVGEQPVSAAARDLRRASRFTPVDVRATLRGVYEAGENGAFFTECRTGQRWRVAGGGAAQQLATSVGRAALVSIDGHVVPGTGEPASIEVTRVVGPVPGASQGASARAGDCAPRFSAAPLENTFWRLTHLGESAAAPSRGPAEPGLTFRDNPRSFGGNGGCNHLAGGYQVGEEALRLQPVGTLRACQDGNGAEALFRTALTDTRGYRILGRTLELLDAERQTLARFEAE
jgi:uncharacterized lipoprotein YbaY/heat shock protein HslJ